MEDRFDWIKEFVKIINDAYSANDSISLYFGQFDHYFFDRNKGLGVSIHHSEVTFIDDLDQLADIFRQNMDEDQFIISWKVTGNYRDPFDLVKLLKPMGNFNNDKHDPAYKYFKTSMHYIESGIIKRYERMSKKERFHANPRAELFYSDKLKELSKDYEAFLYPINTLTGSQKQQVSNTIHKYRRDFEQYEPKISKVIKDGDVVVTTQDSNLYKDDISVFLYHDGIIGDVREKMFYLNMEYDVPPDYWEDTPIKWYPNKNIHDKILSAISQYKQNCDEEDCYVCDNRSSYLLSHTFGDVTWDFYYDAPCQRIDSSSNITRMAYGYSLEPINHEHNIVGDHNVYVVPGL